MAEETGPSILQPEARLQEFMKHAGPIHFVKDCTVKEAAEAVDRVEKKVDDVLHAHLDKILQPDS
jgi:hypothetical protein